MFGESESSKLSGAERVAIVLLSMSEENAGNILNMMSEDEVKEISVAMSNLGAVNQDIVEKLLSRFTQEISGGSSFLGNVQTTEKLLQKILPKDKLNVLMDEIRGPQGKNTWEKLGNVNEEVLSSYLRNEHPQTVALVLSKLNPDHSSRIISTLPEDFSYEVIVRMLNMGTVKKEVLDRVEKILKNEFISSLTKAQKHDSYEQMAEIFNSLDRNSEAKYMSLLEGEYPDSAEKIKDLMFTFEDLVNIDSAGIQKLLRAIDKSKLTIALKGGSEKVKDLFLSNMSQRASRILVEEMESLGPTRVKDVDEAQSEIVAAARDLIGKNEISIVDSSSEEYI